MLKNGYIIVNAAPSDIDELLGLYRSFYGGPADWNREYPSLETVEFDLARNCLFVMKDKREEIVAAASVDDDPAAEALDIWSSELRPSVMVSKICVRRDMQNQGLARVILSYVIDELGKHGKKGVHLLIHEGNDAAMRSYARLGFKVIGERDLYGAHYICMERKIII